MMFAKRLKSLRKEKGITQQQLADLVGATRQSIAGYERYGKEPRFSGLVDIAKYFGCTTDYLLGASDITRPMYVERLRFCGECANGSTPETAEPCRACVLTPGRPAFKSKQK